MTDTNIVFQRAYRSPAWFNPLLYPRLVISCYRRYPNQQYNILVSGIAISLLLVNFHSNIGGMISVFDHIISAISSIARNLQRFLVNRIRCESYIGSIESNLVQQGLRLSLPAASPIWPLLLITFRAIRWQLRRRFQLSSSSTRSSQFRTNE